MCFAVRSTRTDGISCSMYERFTQLEGRFQVVPGAEDETSKVELRSWFTKESADRRLG